MTLNTSSIYFDLVNSLRTVEESNNIIALIEELKGSTFQIKKNGFKSLLNNSTLTRAGALLKELLVKHKVNLSDQIEIEKFLEAIRDSLKKLRSINLTLSFIPNDKMLDRLSAWIKTNISDGIMLDIQYEPSIIGGIKISYYGMYKDYTLDKTINQMLQTQKEQITKLIA